MINRFPRHRKWWESRWNWTQGKRLQKFLLNIVHSSEIYFQLLFNWKENTIEVTQFSCQCSIKWNPICFKIEWITVPIYHHIPFNLKEFGMGLSECTIMEALVSGTSDTVAGHLTPNWPRAHKWRNSRLYTVEYFLNLVYPNKFGLLLLFSDRFSTKRNSVWC